LQLSSKHSCVFSYSSLHPKISFGLAWAEFVSELLRHKGTIFFFQSSALSLSPSFSSIITPASSLPEGWHFVDRLLPSITLSWKLVTYSNILLLKRYFSNSSSDKTHQWEDNFLYGWLKYLSQSLKIALNQPCMDTCFPCFQDFQAYSWENMFIL
jgi:hypothetical protein